MEVYLVGGAVRDKLLGLPVQEKDWVVVGATPQQMIDLGFRPVGKNFPVFLHPDTKEEYALARTERKTGPGYKGFDFHASADVTLEQDLMRRDLTINAMAESADGTLIDPCNGREDLEQGLLRHVSPAFAEDPVRILRVARFAAMFGKWGFRVAHGTNTLMRRMVDNGEVDHLVAERVWAELLKALATDTPEKFFTVLRGCGALTVLFPEIDREYPDDAQSHAGQQLPDALSALQACSGKSADSRVRFGALLLALAPDLNVEQRAQQAGALCRRLRAPNDYTRLAGNAIRLQALAQSDAADDALVLLESAGAFRQNGHWPLLLEVYVAAGVIDTDRAARLRRAGEQAAAINAADIGNPSLSGPAVGAAIRAQRLAAVARALSGAGTG
jgi:tRNA nucleotidyltransferase (CCA-adding enzyme)